MTDLDIEEESWRVYFFDLIVSGQGSTADQEIAEVDGAEAFEAWQREEGLATEEDPDAQKLLEKEDEFEPLDGS
jgi:hypothetical protein